MNHTRGPWALLAAALLVMATLVGCSSGGGQRFPIQSVSERAFPSGANLVVYAAFGGTGQLYVFRINDDGSGNRLLTPLDNDGDIGNDGGFHPAWRPDGLQIAFVRTDAGNNDIFTMGPSGGTATQITTDLGSDMQPCYSPDGTKIAFVSNRDGTNDIWVMDAGGGNEKQITSGPADDRWPCWDPNGDFIAYQSDADGTADSVVDTDIWVVDIQDLDNPGVPSDITDGVANSSDQGAPNWSPGGGEILFHDDVAGSFDIWSLPVTASGVPTGAAVQLIDNPLSQGFPVWYPNGTRFTYVEARSIWSAAADGSDPVQITRALIQP